MTDVDYARAGDPWVSFAVQQLREGTRERARQAYDGAFKRFADTSHSKKLHEEMRKSYVGLGECNPIDLTVATKIKSQRAFSAGISVYGWHPQTFLLPADYEQFMRTYKARPRARWIVKQPDQNRGEGVSMLQSLDQLKPGAGGPAPAVVVQQYVSRPMLVEGFKFHYRYYAMLANPPGAPSRKGLGLWAFPLAPVRFSTAPFVADAADGGGWQEQKNAHVTNSDANKNEVTDYCTASPWRHRTLTSALEYAASAEPHKAALLRPRAVYADSLRVLSRSFGKAARMWEAELPTLPEGVGELRRAPEAEFCHAIYGVDMMLDDAGRVWLIEIQIKPQMDCSCPQDERVKDAMLVAAMRHDLHGLGDEAERAAWHSTRPQVEDVAEVAALAEAEVREWSSGEPEMLRLPLLQWDEDERLDTSRRFTHTYTY